MFTYIYSQLADALDEFILHSRQRFYYCVCSLKQLLLCCSHEALPTKLWEFPIKPHKTAAGTYTDLLNPPVGCI